MKYIIDVPEQLCDLDKTIRIPITINGYDTWVTTNIGLKPYTEPDLNPLVDEAVEAIEKEVWEFASRLMTMHPDVAEDIYWSMNGGKGIGVAAEMTYQEAKAKYDEWRTRENNEVKQKIIDLADEIGIHRLYVMVKEIRGE